MSSANRSLAPYAMHDADTAGRVHPEPGHVYRGPYQRDRDRIVHSSAFRRLADKTQVFTGDMGDYHRSRLTHTLEVASIARTVGRTLGLNEDLIEGLALLHDIGHPPFGHAGEAVLNQRLAGCGGFNHNHQALRIVELLEQRYPDFPGLNLSREVLAGQAIRVRNNNSTEAAEETTRPPRLLEVQVVDAADSIAYNAHDADDAIEIGLIDVALLNQSQLWLAAAKRARQRYAALDAVQFRRAAVHEVIDLLVSDLVAATTARLNAAQPANAADAAACDQPLVGGSEDLTEQKAELGGLLFAAVYRHPTILDQRALAGAALEAMFDALLTSPEQLPKRFEIVLESDGAPRAVADYVACFTDRSAIEISRRRCGPIG